MKIGQFVNVASHDLKAPLRGVAHLTGWIKDDLGESPVRFEKKGKCEKIGCANSGYLGIFESKSPSEGKVDALIHGILDIIDLGDDVDVKIKFDR